MTEKEEINWEDYFLTSRFYECEQNFTLETLYQAFKERMEEEQDARSSLEIELPKKEEWGERIDIELHRHRWDRIIAGDTDAFLRSPSEFGVVYACSCGAMLVPEMDNYHEEAMRMQKYRSTPGAVFEVVEK